MIFQTLDDKKECIGVYVNKELIYKKIPKGLTKTWNYSTYLKGQDIQYGKLYSEGKTLDESCPEHLKQEYENVVKKLTAFKNSFSEAKIPLSENCLFDLTPEHFLKKYCEVKNKITDHIISNTKKPLEYNFYRRFNEILVDIEQRELNIDYELMKQNVSDADLAGKIFASKDAKTQAFVKGLMPFASFRNIKRL